MLRIPTYHAKGSHFAKSPRDDERRLTRKNQSEITQTNCKQMKFKVVSWRRQRVKTKGTNLHKLR